MVGNADLVAGPQTTSKGPLAVHLHAIRATQVAHMPDPLRRESSQ